MLRVIGIPALVVAVVIGLYLAAQGMQSNGPTSAAGQQAISQAQSVGAGVDFGQADTALQAFFDENQTYAGATLPPGSGVVLVRADASSYCLQSGTEHENGPGGQAQPGPC
jgi:hypothetical protein